MLPGMLFDLVEIAEAEEVASLRAHVSDLQRNLLGELRFDVEVVGAIPWRRQALIHSEYAAWASSWRGRRRSERLWR